MLQGFSFTEPRKDITARTWSGSRYLLMLFTQFISSFLVANTDPFLFTHSAGATSYGKKDENLHCGICKTHRVSNDFQAESCCESDAQCRETVQVQYSCNKITKLFIYNVSTDTRCSLCEEGWAQ